MMTKRTMQTKDKKKETLNKINVENSLTIYELTPRIVNVESNYEHQETKIKNIIELTF